MYIKAAIVCFEQTHSVDTATQTAIVLPYDHKAFEWFLGNVH